MSVEICQHCHGQGSVHVHPPETPTPSAVEELSVAAWRVLNFDNDWSDKTDPCHAHNWKSLNDALRPVLASIMARRNAALTAQLEEATKTIAELRKITDPIESARAAAEHRSWMEANGPGR